MENFIQRNLKVIASSFLLLSIVGGLFLMVSDADAAVRVKGYFRKDGTYVQSYYRSNPDGNPYNNWSFPGNVNPYTGKVATGNPDTYLNNYYNNSGSIYTSLLSPSYSGSDAASILKTCGTNQYLSTYNNTCYCSDGYKLNYSTNQCELVTCGLNQTRYGTSCYCNDGYKLNYSTNQCDLVICGANQTRYGVSCYCNDGYKMNYSTKQCELVVCSTNQTRYGINCYCNDGYKMNYSTNQCELVVCGTNQTRYGVNCYCNNGYKMNYSTNQCERVVCGVNQTRYGINCYCNNGYKMNYSTNQCELK